jgi:alpha-1,3-mannosyltransferase
MNPEDTTFDRLQCSSPNEKRYMLLRSNARMVRRDLSKRPNYFFALDLHQSAENAPRLLGSIVETMRFLGPELCVLSIMDGHSDDGTYEILDLLREEMKDLGAQYFFKSSSFNPEQGDRMSAFAELRNEVLQPLVANPEQYAPDTIVIFLNNVILCMEDILEMIWQRAYQGADMTCAMDWIHEGDEPIFHDVSVARGMTGEFLFKIPDDGNYNSAWDLLWNDATAQSRLNKHQPFQVFSCWNGAAIFTAKPLLEQRIKFRHAYEAEFDEVETKLFSKDMWKAGYGKIAMVPTVNIGYTDEQAKKIRLAKGPVAEMVDLNEIHDTSSLIRWQKNPPENVKYMRSNGDQLWIKWDEGLP